VVAHYSPEDWQYGMDIPDLYSLIWPDGKQHDVMLQEESNSSKAGYASSAHARLSLSFKMKVPDFLEQTGQQRMGTPSPQFLISVSGNLLELKRLFTIK
jgi:hypothetical protein